MTSKPLWVILCHLPERGRKKIEDIVEEMKERDNRIESEETEEIKTFLQYPYLLQGFKQALPNVSQYQLDTPLT